ncbi:GNAT family N-acetyltransferase [Heyndrickxia oleronia]|uniref:GNAT family N-acetyltransferase n=1 Tax=Heyndrickxia oleronia TaxID=38875 RepID=A0AAW6T6G5_9BACI|nr:GNAT family N-acetyltransferase [Heyndrickxia oleronia]MDH5164431.1 GNAT family N-acetyltransferase [Heyndrickxia oleronia]
MINLISVSKENKHILENMYQFYNYDFSEFTQEDINRQGLYDVDLEYFWQDPRWNPFFINQDGKIIGFLVVLFENYDVDPDPTHVIYDFMILKNYRRNGLGKEAAIKAFNLYNANWKVAQMALNEPSKQFWRNIIKEYTNDSYTEIYRHDLKKYIQTFCSKN